MSFDLSNPVVIGALGTLIATISAALGALLRLPQQKEKDTVSVAGEIVVMQKNVMTGLYEEIKRLRENHEECEKARDEDREQFTKDIQELRALFKLIDERKNQERRSGDSERRKGGGLLDEA